MQNAEEDIIPTQFIKKNFDITGKIDENFLNSIKEAFEGEVSVISLALLISNKDDVNKKEIISFNYRNDKEQKNKEVIVDLNDPNSFKKIRKIL